MNTSGFQELANIAGEDDADSALLRRMAMEARAYIQSFKWCPPVRSAFLASGVGGIAAIFLFDFLRPIQGEDSQLWVVVGDIPSAYLVVEPDDSVADAMERYCQMMEDWISAVRDGKDLGEVFPVGTEATPENALQLERRIAFLVAEFLPRLLDRSAESGHS